MKIKNMKIKTQLQAGFGVILLFVILLGVVIQLQTRQLYLHTEQIVEHPLIVREALSNLEADLLKYRIAVRDSFLRTSEEEQLQIKTDIQ
jgi:CHASE3 domain sensor protein